MFGEKKQAGNTEDIMTKGEESPVLPWIFPDEQTSGEKSPAVSSEIIPEEEPAGAIPAESAWTVPVEEPKEVLAEEPAGAIPAESAWTVPVKEPEEVLAEEPAGVIPAESAWPAPAEVSGELSPEGPSGVLAEAPAGVLAEEPEEVSPEEPSEVLAEAPAGVLAEGPSEEVPEEAEEMPPEEPDRPVGRSEAPENAEYTKPKKKHGPVFIWGRRIILTVLILAASLLMTFAYSLWSEYSNDQSYEGRDITVEIPKGSTIPQIGEILKDAGVTRYKTTFVAKAVFNGYRGKLKYGIYKLNDGSCLPDILEQLTAGGSPSDENLFTVPEGYTVEMIADRLEKEGLMTSEDFLAALDKAAEDFEYADQLPAKDKVFYQLQGYLYPDTYHITEGMTADQLVHEMLSNFTEKFDAGRQAQAKKIGLSVEEVLIRASMVQKESDRTEDYATIAGVINNRLAKKMKIQFDSTVVYAMTNGLYGVDRVTHENLKLESPYNTYYVKGLPPGPICNPGLSAIDGVLNAEEHKYLFFRSDPNKDDGSNIFTETYEEHNAVSEGSTGGE